MALTAKKIDQCRKQPGLYLDGGDLGQGLYLQVTKGGASWLFRYEIKDPSPTPKRKDGRRERWMGLGSLKTFSLKQARERAKAKRQLLADGIDPLEQKKADKTAKALAAAKAITFEEAAQAYFDQHEKKWSNAKHRAQFLSTLKEYAFPKIGKLAVADVDTGQYSRSWNRNTKTIQTNGYGKRSPKPLGACAAELKRCWIGAPRAATAAATTPRAGKAISTTCYRRVATFRR